MSPMGLKMSNWSFPKAEQWNLFDSFVWRVQKDVIRPFTFQNGNMTRDTYERLLRYHAAPKLQECPEHSNVQQHGTPALFSVFVRQYLNRKYLNHWMRKASSISWSPLSSDLTPSDYLKWGYLKGNRYGESCDTVSESKTHQTGSFKHLQNTSKTGKYFMLFIEWRDTPFEHLLNRKKQLLMQVLWIIQQQKRITTFKIISFNFLLFLTNTLYMIICMTQ